MSTIPFIHLIIFNHHLPEICWRFREGASLFHLACDCLRTGFFSLEHLFYFPLLQETDLSIHIFDTVQKPSSQLFIEYFLCSNIFLCLSTKSLVLTFWSLEMSALFFCMHMDCEYSALYRKWVQSYPFVKVWTFSTQIGHYKSAVRFSMSLQT